MKVLCLLIIFSIYARVYYLNKSWKTLIISVNEEIYDSIQKLVHYLPQMNAIQKIKTVIIKTYEFVSPKKQIN